MLKPYYWYDKQNNPINPMDLLKWEAQYLKDNLDEKPVLVDTILDAKDYVQSVLAVEKYNSSSNRVIMKWLWYKSIAHLLETFHKLADEVILFEKQRDSLAYDQEKKVWGFVHEPILWQIWELPSQAERV